jgi:hypothetical protein
MPTDNATPQHDKERNAAAEKDVANHPKADEDNKAAEAEILGDQGQAGG